MNLSEICYEAACNMSNHPRYRGDYSCTTVSNLDLENTGAWIKYSELMSPEIIRFLHSEDVEDAAFELGWSLKSFRTFLLLMAAEAFK